MDMSFVTLLEHCNSRSLGSKVVNKLNKVVLTSCSDSTKFVRRSTLFRHSIFGENSLTLLIIELLKNDKINYNQASPRKDLALN